MSKPRLFILADELRTQDRDDLADVISHVEDDNYPREQLVLLLATRQLRYFAHKLQEGYYDRRYYEAMTAKKDNDISEVQSTD